MITTIIQKGISPFNNNNWIIDINIINNFEIKL